MSNTDEIKPKGRARQRGGKAKPPGGKPDQRHAPKPEGRQDDSDRIQAAVVLNEPLPVEAAASPDPAAVNPVAVTSEPHAEGALVPIETSPIGVVAGPVETFWIGFHTIAQAYRDCAWRSIEETMVLVENMSIARSLDQTVELHTDFIRQGCDGFVRDSQKTWRLYSEFTRQIFLSFERLLSWRTPVSP